jgi:hypothetical protein
MKQQLKFWSVSLLMISIFCLAGCDDDDDKSSTNVEKSYTLDPLSNSGVSGTVTFRKQNGQTTLVTIKLTGTQGGNSHPAHIHANSASMGGPIVLDFNPVDGATGTSETPVTKMNDGTAVTYEQLIAFNGHVNVHLSVAQIATMIAQGNIGSNSEGVASTNSDGGY